MVELRDRSDDVFEYGPDRQMPMWFAVQHLIWWDTELFRKLSPDEVEAVTGVMGYGEQTLARYHECGERRIALMKDHPEVAALNGLLLQVPFKNVAEGLRRGLLGLVKVV